MATLNLHNWSGTSGAKLVRVPHLGSRGLGSVPVDEMGGTGYCKLTLTSAQYVSAYAQTTDTRNLAPASVWATYDQLGYSLPAWLSTTGTPGVSGTRLTSGQTLTRAAQSLEHIVWGFTFTLEQGGQITVGLGSWAFTLQDTSALVSYANGMSDMLSSKIESGREYDVVIEQRQASATNETTLIVRLDADATLMDVVPSLTSATSSLSITGGAVVVSGWRQGVCEDVNPTLSVVQNRAGSVATNLAIETDNAGTVYDPPTRTGYTCVSQWGYEWQGTEYQLISWMPSAGGTGLVSRRTPGSGTMTDVLSLPPSDPASYYLSSWAPNFHWGYAQDSRGWLYALTNNGGNFWDEVEVKPDPGPQVFRSRDGGLAWEALPIEPGVYSRGRYESYSTDFPRHGHAIAYHPGTDTLYATFGEEHMTHNTIKFTNLSAINRDAVVCTPIGKPNIKGGLGFGYNGTPFMYLPPDGFPTATIRLDTQTDTWRLGPRHRGVFGALKWNISAVPTEDFGTLLLGDCGQTLESPGYAFAYSQQHGTTENAMVGPGRLTYRHSQTNATIKNVGDVMYFGWEHPPNALQSRYWDTIGVGGLCEHEYWNGSSWVAMATSGDSQHLTLGTAGGGYDRYNVQINYPTSITNWGRRRPSDFGFTGAPLDDSVFWTRLRCTSSYSVGPKATYWWLQQGAAGCAGVRGVYFYAGDVLDTEVEYSYTPNNGIGMTIWKEGDPQVLFGASLLAVQTHTSLPMLLNAVVAPSSINLTWTGTGPFRIERRVVA